MKAIDLNLVGSVTGLYELSSDKVYLVLVDAKKFDYGQAYALLRKVEESGINLQIHMVATLYPKGMEIHEATP